MKSDAFPSFLEASGHEEVTSVVQTLRRRPCACLDIVYAWYFKTTNGFDVSSGLVIASFRKGETLSVHNHMSGGQSGMSQSRGSKTLLFLFPSIVW